MIQAYLGHPERSELARLEANDAYPRIILFEQSLNSDMLNEKFLENVHWSRKIIYRILPIYIAQAIEGFIIRKRYDAVISWAENLGIPFAGLVRIFGHRPVHFGIFSWISKLKKAAALKCLHSQFDRIILMSSRQRNYAVDKLKIPTDKVLLLQWPVDQRFWRPISREADMICAVGREMRDYATLIEAVKELDIPCHIAAGGIKKDKRDAWIKDLKRNDALPKNVTIGKKSYSELRELYARSRFVVVPLYETETDNGTTSILEAMAMGKAVICSHVKGQTDVIRDGINGMFVPVGDHKALREAIEYLWMHPEVAERMGMEGRKYVEENNTLDNFVRNIKKTMEQVIEEKRNTVMPVDNRPKIKRKRIITIVSLGLSRPPYEELRELEEKDRYPRILLFEDKLESDLLDEHYLNGLPLFKRIIYKPFPKTLVQLVEAFLVRKKYEAVVTWSGKISLPFALILKLTRSKIPHVALLSWITKPKKVMMLKFVHAYIDRIILWSSTQMTFAKDVLKIPSEKLVFVSRRVDQKFWRPMNVKTDMICSAGQEMRDYPTFIKAMSGLDIKCHIATGALRGKLYKTVKDIGKVQDLPANISVGKLDFYELRDLYARSRFVVIPLHKTDTDNGVTIMEEAMAMGKAVICTRTQGQVDHLKENETGIFVPPYDVEALRNAILYLWNNPDIAESMGKRGREYIETYNTFDKFVDSVKDTVDEAIQEHRQKKIGDAKK